jgi:hypothetical protein
MLRAAYWHCVYNVEDCTAQTGNMMLVDVQERLKPSYFNRSWSSQLVD